MILPVFILDHRLQYKTCDIINTYLTCLCFLLLSLFLLLTVVCVCSFELNRESYRFRQAPVTLLDSVTEVPLPEKLK